MSRRRARKSLAAFTEYLDLGFTPARHHRLLIDKLEAVERGEIKRLMVFMPPGSAKSAYANVLFSTWYLGRNEDSGLITASYGQELADKWGRRSRSIVASDAFRSLFGFGLSSDSTAVDRWATEKGGEYLAAGVGGPVTGNRADGGIIDDPVKGREEAESETKRQRVWEWYQDDFWTRLKPHAWVVLIMTRWHEDDLAGRLLAEQEKGGEKWEVLSLPAIAGADDPLGREIGERLWPEWFPEEMFAEARRDGRRWSALYQQQPVPDSGDFFRREWFHRYEERPKHLSIYGMSDYAVTDRGGDFTEHGVFGIDPEENIYVLDWWSGQTTSDVWIEEQLDLIAKWKPFLWVGEGGVIRRAVEPFLTKRSRERKVYCRYEWLPSITDKPTRARGFQARASMGCVYLPMTPWADDVISQLLRFPAGALDDKVDVCSLLGRALDQTTKGFLPPKDEKKKVDSWAKAFGDEDDDAQNWKTA